jgi:hypothetical protein
VRVDISRRKINLNSEQNFFEISQFELIISRLPTFHLLDGIRHQQVKPLRHPMIGCLSRVELYQLGQGLVLFCTHIVSRVEDDDDVL